MGKIYDSLDAAIMTARKERDADKLKALTNMKKNMLEFKTAKSAKPLDDAAETAIIKKMVKELKEDISLYYDNDRPELAIESEKELFHIEKLLPQEASKDDILKVLQEITNNTMKIDKKDMGNIIKTIKTRFDNVDGKLVASLVMQCI